VTVVVVVAVLLLGMADFLRTVQVSGCLKMAQVFVYWNKERMKWLTVK